MSQTTVNLGYVLINRGKYVADPETKYYKDNVVQYQGSAFIASPVDYDEETNPLAYVTTAPYDTDPNNPNEGWKVFAADAAYVNSFMFFTENPEWAYVVCDKEDKILFGVKQDGKFYFGDGCPPQVKSYVSQQIAALDLQSVPEIVAFLQGLLGTDTTLKMMLDAKVDIEEGKSLIDEDFAHSISIVDSQEFVEVETDSEDKIMEGTKTDGTKYFGGGIHVGGDAVINGDLKFRKSIGVYEESILPIIKIKEICHPDDKTIDIGEYYITNTSGVIGYRESASSYIGVPYKENAKYNIFGRIFVYDGSDSSIFKIKDTSEVIDIKAMSGESAAAPMLSPGDYYFNTNNNKLYIVFTIKNGSVTAKKESPLSKDKLYLYNGKAFIYNGTSLVLLTDSLFDSEEISITKGTINSNNGAPVSSNTDFVTSLITKKPVKVKTNEVLYIRYIYEYSPVGDYIGLLVGPDTLNEYFYTGKNAIKVVFNRQAGGNVSDEDKSDIKIESGISDVVKNVPNDMLASQTAKYEVGTVNSNTGANVYVADSIRTNIIANAPVVVRTNSILYIRYAFEYKKDGTYIGMLFGPKYRKDFVYSGENAVKLVFARRAGGNVSLNDDVNDIRIYNGLTEFAEITQTKPTAALKLIVTGDSIPHGQVLSGTPPMSPYPNLVADALGAELTNYAIGGSTFTQASNFGATFNNYEDFIAAEKDTSKLYVVLTGNQTFEVYKFSNNAWSISVADADKVRTPISSRYQYMDDGDIVLVHCGTNDFEYAWTFIGTMDDRTPTTLYGALHYTILGLLEKYYSKIIIFCTPIKRAQPFENHNGGEYTEDGVYLTPDSKNKYGKTLGDYSNIIKEVCAYYSIPVIDLYNESGLNPVVDSQHPLFDSQDGSYVGTHPYQLGHDMIARVVAGKIKSLYA